jgi:S1-C subfamily serine protease
VVTDVLPASPAAALGLSAGDIILAFDNSETPTMEDLTAALQQAGRSAEIVVQRSGTAEPSRAIIYPRGNWIGVSGRTVAVGY